MPLKWILFVKKLNVHIFLFRTKCINFPCKRHFINKMEGIINIVHISLQSKCSTCSRSFKNDQTCNDAYRKWRGGHNFRFTRYLRPLKLRHYEKATKFEKISHLFWHNSCFYSDVSKQVGDFFQILWPSQKTWTLL